VRLSPCDERSVRSQRKRTQILNWLEYAADPGGTTDSFCALPAVLIANHTATFAGLGLGACCSDEEGVGKESCKTVPGLEMKGHPRAGPWVADSAAPQGDC
jgi:hypothetical protein